MKKTLLVLTGILTALLIMTGCTRSDHKETTTAETGSTQGAQSSGTLQGQGSTSDTTLSDAGAEQNEDNPVITVVGDGTQTDTSASQPDGAAQSLSSVSNDSQSAADSTYDEVNQSGDAAVDDATYDSIMQSGEDLNEIDWQGNYDRDDGEALSITSQANGTFFFRFELCQIAGTAYIDSDYAARAVYNGDDDNNIVFTISEDIIEVTVTNSNGDDTSEAAMTGAYELSDDEDEG